MVFTTCKDCGKKTPFKAHNSPEYWYCKYCKAPLHPFPLGQLSPKDLQEKVKKDFPQATHYLKSEGDIASGGPVVIDVPTLSKATTEVPARPAKSGLILVDSTGTRPQRLGEYFLHA